ncbi:MAG: choline/ethanolamine kinase family protein [Xanthomonadales bacterium]|nr:choline/ethanolamine kinase family protein [Xanthomonadales bacterium]
MSSLPWSVISNGGITYATTAKSLQPENALTDWRQWSPGLRSKPLLSGELNGGLSNQSYLLQSDIGKLVVRINGTGSLLPGANRSDEINIWKVADKQGIAPALIFVDPEHRYLVSKYIKNKLPPKPQLNTAVVDQAFSLLESCHQLDVEASSINYLSHIEHYWQIIEAKNQPINPNLCNQRKPIQQTLDALINSDTPTGICHHDPVIANFVGTPKRLYLIDWEYAANGLQIMDYAALATEWQIDDATMHRQTGIDLDLLTMASAIYTYLRALWQEIVV